LHYPSTLRAFFVAPLNRSAAFAYLPHLIAIVAFIACIGRFYDAREGFTSLIGFGSVFASRQVAAVASLPRHVYRRSSGYDGQFYAQMATDPLLKDPATDRAMDDMPLRARRILFAWTAYVAGLGRPWWIVQAYALQNVVCWIALSLLLLRWFEPGTTRMVALWTATLFSGGLLWSVRFALLDGPSLLMIAAAVAAVERNRSWLAAAVLGVASLGRETNLLAISILPPAKWSWSATARVAVQAVLVTAPLVIWFDYLYSLYRDQIYTSGGTISLPFSGLAWKLQMVWADAASHGIRALTRAGVMTLVSVIVQAGYVLIRLEGRSPWWRLGVAYAGLLLLLGRPLWEGELPTAMRVMIPLALAFNVLLRDCLDPRRFWSLLIAGNLTVLYAPVLLRVWR
jgi:hypothetical protein